VIAALIGAASLFALLPVFVSYCGTLLSSARRVEISDRVAALAGVRDGNLAAGDFDRILQLVRLCPEHDADRSGIRLIRIYYRMIHALGAVFGGASPDLVTWAERERGDCSHFAAVVLDRCISSSRSLLTRQVNENP